MIDILAAEQTSTSIPQHTPAGPDMDDDPSKIVDICINERVFGIRAADVDEHRSSASMLINKMYAWRGYSGNHRVGSDPNRITLTASDKGRVIGTLSLGLDSEVGLLADQVFQDHIDPYRKNGKVCEIIRFAIDPDVKSKAVLASLFHVSFLYAMDLNDCTDIFIEVNPRHRRYYEAMLGFQVECESRHNDRVDAPAVLLRGSTAYGREKIATLAGKWDASNDRSLYPYFFSPREVVGILNRLKQIG